VSISHTAHLNEPSDEIDLDVWIFGLSDGNYQACAKCHQGGGVFTDEQSRGMINVESIPIKVCDAWGSAGLGRRCRPDGSSVRLGMLHLRRGAPASAM